MIILITPDLLFSTVYFLYFSSNLPVLAAAPDRHLYLFFRSFPIITPLLKTFITSLLHIYQVLTFPIYLLIPQNYYNINIPLSVTSIFSTYTISSFVISSFMVYLFFTTPLSNFIIIFIILLLISLPVLAASPDISRGNLLIITTPIFILCYSK